MLGLSIMVRRSTRRVRGGMRWLPFGTKKTKPLSPQPSLPENPTTSTYPNYYKPDKSEEELLEDEKKMADCKIKYEKYLNTFKDTIFIAHDNFFRLKNVLKDYDNIIKYLTNIENQIQDLRINNLELCMGNNNFNLYLTFNPVTNTKLDTHYNIYDASGHIKNITTILKDLGHEIQYKEQMGGKRKRKQTKRRRQTRRKN